MRFFYSICILFFFFFNVANAQYIAWTELGGVNSLSADGEVNCICEDLNGNIYVATYRSVGGIQVLKYDGNNWTSLGLNYFNNKISSICSDNVGNIYAAGEFTNALGHCFVAKYDGNNWTELGGLDSLAANGIIRSICSDLVGDVYAAGNFTNAFGGHYVAKFNGSSWSELGGFNSLAANGIIKSICRDTVGNVYAAGDFRNASFNSYVAKFDGTSWSPLGVIDSLGYSSSIGCICADLSGSIYLSKSGFLNSNGNTFVAKFDGSKWFELGGLDGLSNAIGAVGWPGEICTDFSGNVYVYSPGGVSPDDAYILKFNGTSWAFLGIHPIHNFNGGVGSAYINSLFSDHVGNIYAGGRFQNSSGFHYVSVTKNCNHSARIFNENLCFGGSVIINNKLYNKTGIYYDTLINVSGCDSFITLHLNIGLDTAKICLVTVDSSSNSNIVVWEKNSTVLGSIDSFRIYRETASNSYSYLASIHRDSFSVYRDLTANPNNTSYKYKLTAIDTCGHVLAFSHYHNTIHLQNLGNGNFQWTNYQIENEPNPVSYYVLLRDDNSTGNFQPISSSIPGANSTFTDINFANYPNASYRLSINWSIQCSPTKSYFSSYSNIIKLGNAGISNSKVHDLIKVWPNPTSENATITLPYTITNAKIKLFNVAGKPISEVFNLSGNNFVIDISNEISGIYFAEIFQEEVLVGRVKVFKY